MGHQQVKFLHLQGFVKFVSKVILNKIGYNMTYFKVNQGTLGTKFQYKAMRTMYNLHQPFLRYYPA